MSPKKSPLKRRYFLGFDGGGTKTDCVLADASGAFVAKSAAGPSNPLRAGYSSAWRALSKAADAVLVQQHLKPGDVRGVCAGIAGAGRESVARRAVESLQRRFPSARVEVTTDLAITLEAALGEREGIVLVAGTGSAAFGRNANGRTSRAGGYGPWLSDEGSAFDIGRRALAAVVLADERRGPSTALSDQLYKWLDCKEWDDVVAAAMRKPDEVFPRMFPLVAKSAGEGDSVSRKILLGAAESLAELVGSVVERLEMRNRQISIALAGGTIGRSEFFDGALRAALHRITPRAHIVSLEMTPAEAAARRAARLAPHKPDA